MRYTWVLEDDRPDIAKAEREGIGGFYFDPRDPWVTRERLISLVDRGYAVGIYGAWNWAGMETGPAFAEWMDGHVRRLDVPELRVQFDIEVHDPAYVLACLTRWRKLQPARNTSWTLESFQGGWMSPLFVAAILALRVRIVPQYYTGAMKPQAADRAMLDLARRGFPTNLISGFYDGAALPEWWDGFAYHQGRIPSS